MMTPKERVLAFYRHEIPDELPTERGMFILYGPSDYEERSPFVQSGKDWFGVEWLREEDIGAIAPDHTEPPHSGGYRSFSPNKE